ncbi:Penicillin-binding protein [Caenorhabditis elegans]|uniref:Penicillin-binding protein n=1 Tax=Caenorhabditis elegans TaxID=6239 RepID=D7SFL7_CAEEL|nr:Penicillin-binding protein [Caenorhabditis elegans]CBM41194.1 Penicillin-binding protein [Caenorhabditis elegans]|eukprot:NP_001257082.1 Uncharacterized protein CELE_C43C3.4 [Caenorhabditis elegans]
MHGALEDFLTKRGYSKYALQSEIVTEDMLDGMSFEANSYSISKDKNGNDQVQINQADGKPFETQTTVVQSCN